MRVCPRRPSSRICTRALPRLHRSDRNHGARTQRLSAGRSKGLAARAIPVKRTVRKGDIFIRLESHAALHPRRAPSVSNRVPHPLSQRFTPYVSATYPIPATNPAPRSAPYAYAAASVVVVAAPVDDADAEAFIARPAFSRHSLVSVVAA